MPNMTRKVSALMALLLGGQPTGLQRNIEGKRCQLCYSDTNDDVVHVLWACQALDKCRKPRWENVISTMPESMAQDIQQLQWNEITLCILSGLGKTYIPEWSKTYVEIVNFMYEMYLFRAKLYDTKPAP